MGGSAATTPAGAGSRHAHGRGQLLLELADDVIWMVAGTTHVPGNAAEARRHDAFIRDYLGWTTH